MPSEVIRVTQQNFGQRVTLKTGEDLSDASQFRLIFKPPTGDEKLVTGICDDEPEGEVYWISTSGFWTMTGEWKAIARIAFGTDECLYTRPVAVMVTDRFIAE